MEEKDLKATGIVRRIDDLGRIVIPKEIRKTQRIREGNPVEIFTNREGDIMLKKYSPIGELSEFALDYAESLAQVTGGLACITDKDTIIAAAGPTRREYEGKPLDSNFERVLEKRATLNLIEDEQPRIKIIADDDCEYDAEVISTIICNGDCVGAVAVCGKGKLKTSKENLLELVQTAVNFLGKQLE